MRKPTIDWMNNYVHFIHPSKARYLSRSEDACTCDSERARAETALANYLSRTDKALLKATASPGLPDFVLETPTWQDGSSRLETLYVEVILPEARVAFKADALDELEDWPEKNGKPVKLNAYHRPADSYRQRVAKEVGQRELEFRKGRK